MLWKILRYFLFLLDAETAHRLTVRLMRFANRLHLGPFHLLEIVSRTTHHKLDSKLNDPKLRLWGMDFLNPVGLAAGFDKDAELVEPIYHLGFGFMEIGTVTPRPQPGNPKPRLFRNPAEGWVFNRMGFNGMGAEHIQRELAQWRNSAVLPESFRIGVNLGKNKDTSNEDAHLDYIKAARAFEGLADYLVVNVSSPNTPNLRSLQTRASLTPILTGITEVVRGWKKVPPILLKLAPELFLERILNKTELSDLIQGLESEKILQGWVVTNTLGGEHYGMPGGMSGKVLTAPSREALQKLRALSSLPIISVGGICSEEEARWRLQNGANLIQIYSGWIFQGPDFASRIVRFLREKG